jgi:hypothetical protein
VKSARIVFTKNRNAETAHIESDEVDDAIVLRNGDTAMMAKKINMDDRNLVLPKKKK